MHQRFHANAATCFSNGQPARMRPRTNLCCRRNLRPPSVPFLHMAGQGRSQPKNCASIRICAVARCRDAPSKRLSGTNSVLRGAQGLPDPSHTSRMAGPVPGRGRVDSTSSSTNRRIRTGPPASPLRAARSGASAGGCKPRNRLDMPGGICRTIGTLLTI